jgi:hypothetical protein
MQRALHGCRAGHIHQRLQVLLSVKHAALRSAVTTILMRSLTC